MHKIRVMIVEDSRVIRVFLEHVIGGDPRLEVVASVESGEEALRNLHQVSPDVISMDIRLPGMNGFDATQRIMQEKPTPIVVVSANVESDELKISMNALRAGALAVVEKPVGTTHADYETLAHRLCTQLAIMSQVRVVRQRAGLNRKAQFGAPEPPQPPSAAKSKRSPDTPLTIMGLVASTGGPAAVLQLLNALPADFPLPILFVQHIVGTFMPGFIDWLNDVCPQRVVEAKSGQLPKPGHVYVAPADHHLRMNYHTLHLDRDNPISAQRPSGTVLLQSMARHGGSHSLGVLLTGMGDDGAQGLKELRDAGGYTIAEDETTAVVYGMPAVAVQLGAVCESLPLQAIAPRIQQLLTKKAGRPEVG